MVIGEDRFERRKRAESLLLADVMRPRQSTNRPLLHVVLKNLREEQFVFDERSAEIHSGCRFLQSDHASGLTEHRRYKTFQPVAKSVVRRLGFHFHQPAGKTSATSVIRRLL